MAAPNFIFHSPLIQGTLTGAPSLTTTSSGGDVSPAIQLKSSDSLEFDVSSQSYAEGWLTFYSSGGQQDSGGVLALLSGATTDLLRITATNTASSGGTQAFEYWTGSAWTSIGTTGQLQATSKRIDIHWHIHASAGVFELYIDGVLDTTTGTVDTLHTADTTINTITIAGMDSTDTWDISNILVDGSDTRGLFCSYEIGTSDGFYTEWTNSEPNVDNIIGETLWNSAVAVADAANERFTMNFQAINATFAGYTVESVCILGGGQSVTEPGLYLKPLLRKSSTDYEPSGSFQLQAANAYWGGVQMDVDPSTAAAWANIAAVEAFEYGLKSSGTA